MIIFPMFVLRRDAAATLAVRMEVVTDDALGKNRATGCRPARSQVNMGSGLMTVVHDSSIYIIIYETDEPGVGAIHIQLRHTEK